MAVVLAPLLVLSYYNHPSIADDYCYIDTVFKYSWLEAMNFYYSGWTGRYFGIFLNHSNPLLFHSVIGFKVLPVLLLSAFIFALYSLFRHLTPTLSKLAHLGFAGIVFFMFVTKMASIVEAFYWMAAFVTYTIPNILTLFWIVLVLRWYRQDTQSAKLFVSVLSGFLIFAIIGCSETNLIVIMLLILAWCFYMVVFHRRFDGFMISMLVTGVVSCYIFFASPGNAARIGGNPLGGNFSFSLISSFQKLGVLVYEWVFTTPLLFFTILWLVVLSRLSKGARNYFSIPVWFAVLLYIGIESAQLFPSYYGVGIEPTPRVINCVYFFFLIGWFYVSGVIFHYFNSKYGYVLNLSKGRFTLICGIAALSVTLSFYQSNNVKVLYSDILKGRAAAFDKENYERYNLLKTSKERVVYLPELSIKPQTLFVDDIKTDKTHWWNKCLAGYYGKDTVYVIEQHVK